MSAVDYVATMLLGTHKHTIACRHRQTHTWSTTGSRQNAYIGLSIAKSNNQYTWFMHRSRENKRTINVNKHSYINFHSFYFVREKMRVIFVGLVDILCIRFICLQTEPNTPSCEVLLWFIEKNIWPYDKCKQTAKSTNHKQNVSQIFP